jgi:hypothetical protein
MLTCRAAAGAEGELENARHEGPRRGRRVKTRKEDEREEATMLTGSVRDMRVWQWTSAAGWPGLASYMRCRTRLRLRLRFENCG